MRLVVDCMVSINNITIVNLYVYVCLSVLFATHTFVYAICNNVCKGTFHVTVSTRTILALVGLGTSHLSQSVCHFTPHLPFRFYSLVIVTVWLSCDGPQIGRVQL